MSRTHVEQGPAFALGLLLSFTSWSQQAAAPDSLEEVVVTGTRAALAESLDRKRDAQVVQDSIVAEDLGRFPDANVADSLSHINPKMIGKNMMDLRDADGKYHIKERMEAAQKGTSGWQDFKFYNPVSKKIEPKRMYWEKYDNLVFAAGAYKPE